MAAQVPIGVIDASRGGTTVETWTPAHAHSRSGEDRDQGSERPAWRLGEKGH